MSISNITDRPVAVAGYGVEGASVVRALRRWGHAGAISVLTDEPVGAAASATGAGGADGGVRWVVGPPGPGALAGHALLVKSPGIAPSHPTLAGARAAGVPITTATNLYIERVREAGLPVVGITGSKGKSTTTTLIHRALSSAGHDAVLVGNIGVAALDVVDEVIARRAVSVFEMSSYQCHDLSLGPTIAVLLTLFPEHLDWHGSLDAYYAAKLRIADTQRASDTLVVNLASEAVSARVPRGPGRLVGYGDGAGIHFRDGVFHDGARPLFGDEGFRLRGAHNRLNACAALTAVRELGVAPEAAREAIATFEGLPHRCEVVGTFAGVRWINDAISTAPEAASAALEAFAGQVGTLIAGGFDRGYDFSGLAADLRRHQVQRVAVLAPSGLRLASALRAARGDALDGAAVFEAGDLGEAVAWAARETAAGATCLFSPASPSYGRYRDFQKRGEHFRELVRALGERTDR